MRFSFELACCVCILTAMCVFVWMSSMQRALATVESMQLDASEQGPPGALPVRDWGSGGTRDHTRRTDMLTRGRLQPMLRIPRGNTAGAGGSRSSGAPSSLTPVPSPTPSPSVPPSLTPVPSPTPSPSVPPSLTPVPSPTPSPSVPPSPSPSVPPSPSPTGRPTNANTMLAYLEKLFAATSSRSGNVRRATVDALVDRSAALDRVNTKLYKTNAPGAAGSPPACPAVPDNANTASPFVIQFSTEGFMRQNALTVAYVSIHDTSPVAGRKVQDVYFAFREDILVYEMRPEITEIVFDRNEHGATAIYSMPHSATTDGKLDHCAIEASNGNACVFRTNGADLDSAALGSTGLGLTTISLLWTRSWRHGVPERCIAANNGAYRFPCTVLVKCRNGAVFEANTVWMRYEDVPAQRRYIAAPADAYDEKIDNTQGPAPVMSTPRWVNLHNHWLRSALAGMASASSILPLLHNTGGRLNIFIVFKPNVGDTVDTKPGRVAGPGSDQDVIDFFEALKTMKPSETLYCDETIDELLSVTQVALQSWTSKLDGYHGFRCDDVKVGLFGIAVPENTWTPDSKYKAKTFIIDDTSDLFPGLSPDNPTFKSADGVDVCFEDHCWQTRRAVYRDKRSIHLVPHVPETSYPGWPSAAAGEQVFHLTVYIEDLPTAGSSDDLMATGSTHSIHYDSYILSQQVVLRRSVEATYDTYPANLALAASLLMTHELGHAMMLDDVYKYDQTVPWNQSDTIMAMRNDVYKPLTDLDHQYVRTLWDLQAQAHSRL